MAANSPEADETVLNRLKRTDLNASLLILELSWDFPCADRVVRVLVKNGNVTPFI